MREAKDVRYIGYGAVHSRVRKARGAASIYTCVWCVSMASEWAYDHKDPCERTESAHGVFSVDVEHYMPLCSKCHRRFDIAIRIAEVGRRRG